MECWADCVMAAAILHSAQAMLLLAAGLCAPRCLWGRWVFGWLRGRDGQMAETVDSVVEQVTTATQTLWRVDATGPEESGCSSSEEPSDSSSTDSRSSCPPSRPLLRGGYLVCSDGEGGEVRVKLLMPLTGPWPLRKLGMLFGIPEGYKATLPGGLYYAMSLAFLDFATDVLCTSNYVHTSHYWFAAVSAGVSSLTLFKHLSQWWRVRELVHTSLRRGFYEDDLLEMLRDEVRVEGVFNLMLNVYGMPFAIDGSASCFTQLLSVCASMFAVATFRVERQFGLD